MSRLADLHSSPLFKNVPEEALRDAAQVTISRHFEMGETLLEQDVDGDTLHLLTRGSVRIFRSSPAGRERIMGDLYAPGIVGETAVLDLGQRSATVVALEPVTSLMLHRQHFEQLLQRHPKLLWNLAVMLARRVLFLNDELIALGQTTEAALVYVLLGLYRQRKEAGTPSPHLLPMTTTDLMNRVSASRETVTRVMRRLEGLGLVTMNSRQITILDPEALADWATEAEQGSE